MQFKYIAALLLVGWVMGTVFDIYNTVTGSSKWLRWLRPTLDIAFWAASAVGVYYVVFLTDDGRIRIYTYLLLLLGYVLYRAVLHHKVVASAFAIVRVLQRLFRMVYQVIYVLTVRPMLVLWRGVSWAARMVYRVLQMLEDALFWVLGFWLKVLVWPFRRSMRQSTFQTIILERWEGLWNRASNWLKNNSERVE